MMKSKWTHNFTYKAGQTETLERCPRAAQRAAAWTDPQSRTHSEGNKKRCGSEGLGRGPCFCKRPLFYCCNTCLHSSVLQGFEVEIAVIPPEWEVYCPLNTVPVPIKMTPKQHMPPSPPCFCKIFLLAFLKVVVSVFLWSVPSSCPLRNPQPQPLPPWNCGSDRQQKTLLIY